MEHWLLYTSEREAGGVRILGVFGSEEEAWEHWLKYDDNWKYWNIPFIEQWDDDKKIEDAGRSLGVRQESDELP